MTMDNNNFDHDDEDQEYPYESHLEGIVSEGIEYMLLMYARDEQLTEGNASAMPFLRRMIRTLRSCADRMEVRVAFLEEKVEEGLSDEEAEQEYFKHFFEDGGNQ